jgi:ubiquitin-like 1-activating enzyme E1 B
VFNADIKNLLIMSDMWRSRSPPVPLDYDGIMDGTFVLRAEGPESSNNGSIASGSGGKSTPVEPTVNGHVHGQSNGNVVGVATGLKDQRALTLRDNLSLFIARCVISGFEDLVLMKVFSTNRLASRLQNGEDTILFDKDDDDTLDFVTASSNLRSAAYGIGGKTRWEVKGACFLVILLVSCNTLHYRDGWQHHPGDCYDKRNYFWAYRPAGVAPPPEVLRQAAQRSPAIQARGSAERDHTL